MSVVAPLDHEDASVVRVRNVHRDVFDTAVTRVGSAGFHPHERATLRGPLRSRPGRT